jgi:hypothetical protein
MVCCSQSRWAWFLEWGGIVASLINSSPSSCSTIFPPQFNCPQFPIMLFICDNQQCLYYIPFFCYSRLDVLDGTGNALGFIEFATEFKYLGSIAHHSLTSDADVDKRIRSASAAFGALENNSD